MVYTPVIPVDGLAGWTFLKSTQERQTEIFDRSPEIQRNVDYFNENIGSVETLDDLMSDRKLLAVALGGFGLGEEIDKGAFVRKVLEEGTADSSAFAVRLNNSDYLAMAKSLVVTDGALTINDATRDMIVSQYKEQAFEEEVGNVNNNMRLALNFEREMTDIANEGLSENAGWFKAMASVPIRTVLEAAFNMPTGFDQLDVDRQKEELADKANSLFGGTSVEIFQDPEIMDKTIRKFLLQAQLEQGPSETTPGYAALSILGGGLGSAGIANLLLSNS